MEWHFPIDRMELTGQQNRRDIQSLREMAMFPDPIGVEVVTGWNHKNGMNIVKKEFRLE